MKFIGLVFIAGVLGAVVLSIITILFGLLAIGFMALFGGFDTPDYPDVYIEPKPVIERYNYPDTVTDTTEIGNMSDMLKE